MLTANIVFCVETTFRLSVNWNRHQLRSVKTGWSARGILYIAADDVFDWYRLEAALVA
jgi:hypothetical protein